MNFIEGYSHRNGNVEWEKRELDEWLTDAFNAPAIRLEAHATPAIREHIRSELTKEGWSEELYIAPNLVGATIFSRRGDLAIQLQTGNISRVFYDLLKLQYLFNSNKIEAQLWLCRRAAAPVYLVAILRISSGYVVNSNYTIVSLRFQFL